MIIRLFRRTRHLPSRSLSVRLTAFAAIALALLPRTSPRADERRIEQDALQLRSVLRELVTESVPKRPEEADRIRRALARHPETLSWILEGRDVRSMVEAADLGGLTLPARPLPGFELPSLAGSDSEKRRLLARLNASSEAGRFELLRKVEDRAFAELASNVREQVKAYPLHQSPAALLLSQPRTQLGVTDETLNRFLEKVLPRHLETLALEDKGRMISAYLELPPRSPTPLQLSTFLQSSGPCLQKLFQLIGSDVTNPELTETMQALQNQIRPFPAQVAISALEQRYQKPVSELFRSFDPTPLAAASVGQVHAAELKNGDRVVVKVRRPGILEIAEREIRGLANASKSDPLAHELLKKVGQTVLDELNFRNEAKNLALGALYERPVLGIGVAGAPGAFEPQEDILLTRRALGAKISKGIETAKDAMLRARAVAHLMRVWFDEAIFGRGFFHGDLHPGNLFFEEDALHPMGYRLTLIDFGNAGALTPLERQAFLKLALSSEATPPATILEIFNSIGSVPEDRRPLLLQAYARILSEESEPSNRIDRILTVSLENGLEVPSSFVSFNRARLFLEKELDALNEALDRLDPKVRLERHSAQRIYRNVTLRQLTRSTLRGLTDAEVRSSRLITTGALLTILNERIQHRTARIARDCGEYFQELASQLAMP